MIITEDACTSGSDSEPELAFNPTLELLRQLYTGGDATRVPDAHSYLMDFAMLSRPGQVDIQEALYQDYKHEQATQTTWHNASDLSIAAAHIPKLVLWGTDDQICDKSPSLLYYHLNKAECEIIEIPHAGHFALEFCNVEEIATHIMKFFFGKGDQTYDYWSISTY